MKHIFSFLLLTMTAAAQQFVISTYAGAPRTLPATPALATDRAIGSVQAVAADPAGNVYFSVAFNGLSGVFKIDQNGILTRFAGAGPVGFSGDGGPAISARLGANLPALAVDSAGNVYIADTANSRIRRVSADGMITTVAGNGPGYYNGAGDGGPAISAQLFVPWQLAVDSDGNLYIGESNISRVRKVSPDGIITTVAGNGTFGYSGDGGPATSAAMGTAWGLACDDAGNLYISDNIPGDDTPDSVRIRRVSRDGIITTVAGTGAPAGSPDTGDGGPATSAQFSMAGSLAVDSAGNLYVADSWRIRRISADGIITTIAGTGAHGDSGDGGPATDATLNNGFYGSAIAVDRDGNLYVADTGNLRVRKISAAGIITTVAGDGTAACCSSGDGGAATIAQLYSPTGVVVDSAGNLYIGDTYNNRIRKVSPDGIITTVAGDGTRGSSGDGGPATNARLNWPAGLALDSSGNLYFADVLNGRVRMISTAGIITTVAGQLAGPKDVALDGSGNLYIADALNSRVRMVSPKGLITTVAGDGRYNYSGDGGPANNAQVNAPSAVAVDNTGNLYIADTNNYRVRKISTSGIITTVAGNGTLGYSGDGGPATSAQLSFPVGVKVDSAGNLYIADGNAVRMVSPAGIITTVAGDGTPGYSGDGGPATSALTGAWGLAFDGSGNLFVSDPWNNVVRLLKPVSSAVR